MMRASRFIACLIYMMVFMAIVAIVPSASSAADIRITSPANGATIKSSDVPVTIELSDATLVAPSSATKKEDLHVIYALDVDTKPFLDGKSESESGVKSESGVRQTNPGSGKPF